MGSLTAAGKSLVAAGQLDQRVILLSPTVAEDELGQRVETMAPVVTVWAQAQPLRLSLRPPSQRRRRSWRRRGRP